MRKGKSVIGKPILSFDEGMRIGEVRDVVLDADNDRVAALLAEEGGLFAGSKIVPMAEVASFGRDAVIVRSQASISPAGDDPGMQAILNRKDSLIGTKVFTVSGDDQGSVADIYFDEADGRVDALEISGGRVTDLTSGTRHLPVTEVVRTGPDVLYVEPEAAEHLDQQRGGMTGAIADAGDKARDVAGSASSAASGAAAKATDAAAQQSPEDQLIGKRAGRDVEDDEGAVLVANGQRITPEAVARTKTAGKLPQLTAAAGLGELGAAGAGTADAVENAGDKAGALWDKFTAKLGDMTDATGRRVDEQQTKQRLATIEDAVGRPVTKVILDLQDEVILDVGDLVTHAAIQRSHDAGSLDSLLGSVYKAEVTFEKDELRARKPGVASLEQAAGEGAPIVEELRTKVETAERERAEAKDASREADEADRSRRAEDRDQRKQSRSTATAPEDPEAQEGELVGVGPGAASD